VLQTILATADRTQRPDQTGSRVAEILEGIWFTALISWAIGTDADAPHRSDHSAIDPLLLASR